MIYLPIPDSELMSGVARGESNHWNWEMQKEVKSIFFTFSVFHINLWALCIGTGTGSKRIINAQTHIRILLHEGVDCR